MSSNMNRYDDQSIRYVNIQKYLTPDEEKQTFLVLQGKCPHNRGWSYQGHSHNDDAYQCSICGEIEWY